ncbi:hypothetical protein [Klebsiella pneumoniae IS46]|nr:hypothetical protein [Klebsiella pneumoniae IS46]
MILPPLATRQGAFFYETSSLALSPVAMLLTSSFVFFG